MKKTTKQLIFPIVVGLISLQNILNNFQIWEPTSVILSFIGLAGVALFMKDKKIASLFFFIWIVAQLVTYVSPNFRYITEQFPYLNVHLKSTSTNSIFSINLTPLFYFFGFAILKTYNLIGKQISIKPIKAESNLKAIQGEIIEVVHTSKKDTWFRVRLTNENEMNLASVLIKPKNDERFSPKKTTLVAVKNDDAYESFIDWGQVIVRKS